MEYRSMNKSRLQLKHTLTYGAIFGVFIVILQLVIFIFGMLNNNSLNTMAPAIFIFGVYLSVKHYRDKLNNGFLTFGKAFGTSLLTCITIGSVWGVYGYILYKYLSPGMLTEVIEAAQDMWLNKGLSEEFVEKATSSISPVTIAFGYITNSLIFGSLLSLLVAAMLMKNINPLLADSEGE
jgi:hypothetical protein